MIPQIIVIAIVAVRYFFSLKNDTKSDGKTSMTQNVIAHTITHFGALALLYWGGFFDCFWK